MKAIELKAAPQFRPGMPRERFLEALQWASPALWAWADKNSHLTVDELYFMLKEAVQAVETK